MTQATDSPVRVISVLASDRPGESEAKASLPVLELDPRTYKRATECVHCGLCLPACPTYTQNGLEADSPRGRIYLMKGLADGNVEPTESVIKHLDLCLDCQACETACPSGVVYHELIEETRERLQSLKKHTLLDRAIRWMFFHVFINPTRLKLAVLPARIMQKVGLWKLLRHPSVTRRLPPQIDKMQQMLPPDGPLWEKPLAPHYPATDNRQMSGKPRAVVGFFPGCVGSVMFQKVNRQAIALLQHAGCDVIVPRGQACCGAIHHHAGDSHGAQRLVRRNIDLFVPPGKDKPVVDYIVNTISGCGASLKHADHLLRDDPDYAERAKVFASINRDVSELLVQLKPAPPKRKLERTVTYHHACHLAHAQKVTSQPLALLSWIPGLKVVSLPEADICCGAAGTYNLTEPQMAKALAERKINNIEQTGAATVVTGNVGCAMQIQSEADRLGTPLTTAHPVSLLYEAYFGK